MHWEMWATGMALLAMFAALSRGKWGPDIVMLGAVLTLLAIGVITPEDAARGFSSKGLITVAFLYVVAAGLKETGAVEMLASRALGSPRSALEAQTRLCLPVATMSAFINNTPIVAMFMPTLGAWGRRHGVARGLLFMPLSFATILGGVCTLIGTSTTVVLAGLIDEHNGRAPDSASRVPELKMFTQTAAGVIVTVVGLAYILLMGRRLLPSRDADAPEGAARTYTAAMRVEEASPIVGKTVEEAGLRRLRGLFLSRIDREGEEIVAVGPGERLRAGDALVFVGALDSVVDLQKIRGLIPAAEGAGGAPGTPGARQRSRLIEAVISPASPLVGETIRDAGFRTRYGGVIVAVRRHGERLSGKLGDIALRAGDALLIEAPEPERWVRAHRDSDAFLLAGELAGLDSSPPRHDRAWAALAILAGLIACLSFNLADEMVACMAAAGGMILFRCCTGPQARAGVHWQTLIVIGASFALGRAMERSGLAGAIAQHTLGEAAALGTLGLLAGVYMMTLAMTTILSNNTAVVLMFPIALEASRAAGVGFTPIAVTMAIAASCEFSTPIGYQTNLMVMAPGGYRWGDYLRFGGPLTLLCAATGIVAVHLLY